MHIAIIRKGIITLLSTIIFSTGFAQQDNCTLTVSGRVTDSDTGLPLSGVTVNITPGPLQVISDAHGYFRFMRLCKGTDYNITASNIGFDNVSMDLTPKAHMQVDIALHHGTITLHDVEVVGHGQSVITANPVKSLSRESIAEAKIGRAHV